MLKKLFSNNTKILLGRWDHRVSERQKNLKFDYSNLDHCGDRVCGDLSHIKKQKCNKKMITSRQLSPELFDI